MTTNNRDKIIAAAKVAGCHPAYLGSFYSSTEALERLYAIAFEDGRQAGMEEAAVIADMQHEGYAAAIEIRLRARSTK